MVALPVVTNQLADFCRRNFIQRLAIFGSAIHDNFRPESDIDVLVEFEPGHVPGLAFFNMQDELSAMFGRAVDLHTPKSLSKYFRDQVIKEAKLVYAQE